MRLKEVLIQGKFCGLETVAECILNFELHTMQMIPCNALEYECKELIKDIKDYEAGKLELPWDEINKRVEDDLKEFKNWCEEHAARTEDEDLDFRLNLF